MTASRTSASVASASACRSASASTIAALVRGTPSASSSMIAGVTPAIMVASSAEPVKARGLGRGMRVLRWGWATSS